MQHGNMMQHDVRCLVINSPLPAMAALRKIQAEAGCHVGFHGIPSFDPI